MTREVLSFTARLGSSEVIYRCDNEPAMRQLLKYVVSTRLSMGLPTRSVTPPADSCIQPWKCSCGKHNWTFEALGINLDALCDEALGINLDALCEEKDWIGLFKQPFLVELGPSTCSMVDEQVLGDSQCNSF